MSLQSWWHYRRAQFFLSFGRRARAMTALRDVLAAEPTDTRALNSLGYLHGEVGEVDQAERYFREALAVEPGNANTLFNLGYLLQKQNRHDEALATFDSALKFNAAIDRAWFGKGMSFAAQNRHTEAIAAFERAAELQPMNPHALYELGLQHHVLGERAKVDEVIYRLRQFDPKATAQLVQATQPATSPS